MRRYVPELRDIPGKQVHQPWKLPGGPPAGYSALAGYDEVKARRAAGAR